MYVYTTFFTHSSIDAQVCCFHILTVVNSAAVNKGVVIPFWDPISIILYKCIEMGLLEHSSIVNFLKNFHIVFHSDCSILHFHQECARCTNIPFSPHSNQYLSFVLVTLILTSLRWYLILICITLVIRDDKLFSYIHWLLYISLRDISIQVFIPVF